MATLGQPLLLPESGWQRIGITDPKIISTVGATGDGSAYSGKYYLIGTKNDYVTFKFFGTKVRLITVISTSGGLFNVSIDGGLVGSFNTLGPTVYKIMMFEKLGLTSGWHTVTITNPTGGYNCWFDCIDIDDTGSLYAIINSQLYGPEIGWRRYDDGDTRIISNAVAAGDGGGYAGRYYWMQYKNDYATFKFYGTKLRLIIVMVGLGSGGGLGNISIDGTTETFTSTGIGPGLTLYQMIGYEKLGLALGVHTVNITNPNGGYYLWFDGIDIDSTGYLITQLGKPGALPDDGWKRYDNLNGRINYIGTGWVLGASGPWYASTYGQSATLNDYLTFKFYGTKLRIFNPTNTDRCNNTKITIDGVTETYSENASLVYNVLVYEKTGLALGVHTVVLTNGQQGYYTGLDAVDIDTNGELIGQVGQSLIVPDDINWRRYDNTDSRLVYTGTWEKQVAYASSYGGGYARSYVIGDTITFRFYGSRLRIISPVNSEVSKKLSISIDGISTDFSEYSPTLIWQVLVYENTSLVLGIHTVVITCGTTSTNIFDAVDIDGNGYLLHPYLTQVSKLSELTISNCIAVRYTALTSGYPGIFTELGTCTANDIPITGTATPDGLLYLIHGGFDTKGKLKVIADRTLQTGISWDTLNSFGLTDNLLLSDSLMQYGGNVCLGQTYGGISSTNAEATYVGGCTPFYAFNGLVTYTGSGDLCNPSGTTNTKLYCKFNTSKTIKRFRVFPYFDATGNYCPYHWYVVGSNDGSLWTKIPIKKWISGCRSYNSNEAETYLKTVWSDVVLDNAISYKYVGIYLRDNYGTSWTSNPISEIQMFEQVLTDYEIGSYNISQRLLTGGITSLDKDDEWDQIIVNSTLNGIITPGDNNIWHWSTMASWTSTTNSGSNSYRVVRGLATKDGYYTGSQGTSWVAADCGYRPLLEVEVLNQAPDVSLITLDRTVTYNKDINISFNLSDFEKDTIDYQILIGTKVIRAYSGYSSGPVTVVQIVSVLDLIIGSNTLTINTLDVRGAKYSVVNTLYKKDNITYVDSNNPTINYVNDLAKIESTDTALLTSNVNRVNGYVKSALLTLIITSSGSIRVSPITSNYDPSSVTYNSIPAIDKSRFKEFIVSDGTNILDITSLTVEGTNETITGYALYSTTLTTIINIGTVLTVTYMNVILFQPNIVYGNRVLLSWGTVIYSDMTKFKSVQLYRDTVSGFGSETMLFETTNFAGMSYTDTTISTGTYFYRLKVVLSDGTKLLSNTISIPVPDKGYREVLTDAGNIIYTLSFAEGFEFTDPTKETNVYTTPDGIRIQPVDIGTVIGGHVGNVFAVEIINTFLVKDFRVTLVARTLDGMIAEPFTTYGRLYDASDEGGRSKVTLSLTGPTSLNPVYPLVLDLAAQQKKIIYFKIDTSLTNTVGAKQIQLRATGFQI